VLADGQHYYVYGNGRIAQYTDTTVEYFLGDALGSVRQLVDGSGNVVLAKDYEPYGEVMNSAGAGSSSYGYTGEWTDNTGMVYLRARYYDPTMGRFMTRDSWGGDLRQPISYNAWLYGYANPIINTDPSGKRPYIPGICPVPVRSAINHRSPEYIFGDDYTYVYCGEFKLTAYQFVVDTGYNSNVMATAVVDGASIGFKVNYDFAKDVEMEGTGRTSRIFKICGGEYIYNVSVNDNNYTFRFKCGKGKNYDPIVDYGRAVAADLTLFSLRDNLFIPDMCGAGRPCNSREYNPHVVVRDAGTAIIRYRLDVFAGEGIGPRASNNAPSLVWVNRHSYLGFQNNAIGPTSVYQVINYWWDDLLISTLSCHTRHIPR
jgi:RHS repeat-associated protein